MKLRTKPGERPNDAEGAALAAPVRMLAERLLRHYATVSGVRVTHFRASSRAVVAACLDEMEGSDAAKEMRLRAVIDDALRESQARGIAHPPLAYVFNVRHVRRRLERLAEAEHLALKATESADMFAEGFDHALGEARAGVRAGAPPVAALERVRPFVETGRVTDAKRLDALARLAEPLTKGGQRLRKTAQDAPTRRSTVEGADSLSTSPRGVYGPEEALRALTARLGEDGPPLPCPALSREVPLTPEERTELEALHESALAQRESRPSGASLRRGGPRAVSGAEDALRVLTALFETVTEPSPVRLTTEVPLTAAERAELEAAQELARARWARAG